MEVVQDGFILETIAKEYKIENELAQLQIMLTIFHENIIIKEKEVNGKIFIETEEIQSPKQSLFDPKDPSIQLGVKCKGSWGGAKCQIDMTPFFWTPLRNKIEVKIWESTMKNFKGTQLTT